METPEQVIPTISNGVTVLATEAVTIAPIVAVFNPAAGAAMQLLAPLVASFVVNSGHMILTFRKDMSDQEVVDALNASKSALWPEPPPIA